MKRFDLRNLHDDFYTRMLQAIQYELQKGEVAIFLFELNTFDSVTKSAQLIEENGYELMNSIKFNQRDWTLVVKK